MLWWASYVKSPNTFPACLWQVREAEVVCLLEEGLEIWGFGLDVVIFGDFFHRKLHQKGESKYRAASVLVGDCISGDREAPGDRPVNSGGGEPYGKCLESCSLLPRVAALICICTGRERPAVSRLRTSRSAACPCSVPAPLPSARHGGRAAVVQQGQQHRAAHHGLVLHCRKHFLVHCESLPLLFHRAGCLAVWKVFQCSCVLHFSLFLASTLSFSATCYSSFNIKMIWVCWSALGGRNNLNPDPCGCFSFIIADS